MGNSFSAGRPEQVSSALTADVAHFFSSNAWIEGRALNQLADVAKLAGVSSVAAFPDLHPGRYGPVGMVAVSHRLHPLLVGNDIGCGMALFELDLPVRRLRLDKASDRLRKLEGSWDGDAGERLVEAGLPGNLAPTSLGTIGGGNHFCELQAIDELFDGSMGLDRENVHLLVHSGSRSVGESVLSSVPGGFGLGVEFDHVVAVEYLERHDQAARWAALNRAMIAERAAEALARSARLIVDVPHNVVRRAGNLFSHHKGAAATESGQFVPIAGSRSTLSYVVRTTDMVSSSLGGLSHGAGRKYDRASMHHRVGRSRKDREDMTRNPWGGVIVCEDKDLLVEEAPEAYKDAGKVVSDLESFGLCTRIAALRPIVTFKRARAEEEATVPTWKERRSRR